MEKVYHKPTNSIVDLTKELKEEIKKKGTIEEYAKILAYPEMFSPQQLQMIVDDKLKEGKCMVECENIQTTKKKDYQWTPEGSNLNYVNVIKLNPYITIYPVEEKMYSRKEVEDICERLYNTQLETFSEFKEWFEQNVK